MEILFTDHSQTQQTHDVPHMQNDVNANAPYDYSNPYAGNNYPYYYGNSSSFAGPTFSELMRRLQKLALSIQLMLFAEVLQAQKFFLNLFAVGASPLTRLLVELLHPRYVQIDFYK